MATTKNATVSVSLTSISGFTDSIGLGCDSLPAGVTCHFSTPSTPLTANGSQQVALTIDTNSPLSGGSSAMIGRTVRPGAFLAGLLMPLSLLFGCIFWRFRLRFARFITIALILITGAASLLVSGCSGFTQSSATPGTYVIQVTGVGTNSDITHYQNVTLTITK
jgi:ABC-type multidrug transport system permease subunit